MICSKCGGKVGSIPMKTSMALKDIATFVINAIVVSGNLSMDLLKILVML